MARAACCAVERPVSWTCGGFSGVMVTLSTGSGEKMGFGASVCAGALAPNSGLGLGVAVGVVKSIFTSPFWAFDLKGG